MRCATQPDLIPDHKPVLTPVSRLPQQDQTQDNTQDMAMLNARSIWMVLLSLLAVLSSPALAQVPEPLPVTNRWELEFRPGPLRLASIPVEGQDRLFLYFTYEVRNYDTTDLRFVPAITLSSDQGQTIPSGQDVPAEVTRTLLTRLRDPLLQDQISIIGPVKRGEEHARRGLAVWPLEFSNPNELFIFAAGFSGESQTLELHDPRTGENRQLVFRKTRQLRYLVPGQLRADIQGDVPLSLIDSRWIMR